MMDKDFVQLNEEELKDVVGGLIDPRKKHLFLQTKTLEYAMEYLKKECYITPSHHEFKSLMKEWETKHS